MEFTEDKIEFIKERIEWDKVDKIVTREGYDFNELTFFEGDNVDLFRFYEDGSWEWLGGLELPDHFLTLRGKGQ